jgi:hypothetical protein
MCTGAARFASRLEPRGDIHSVPVQGTVLLDNIPEIDADTHQHALIRGAFAISLCERILNCYNDLDCQNRTGCIGQPMHACPSN